MPDRGKASGSTLVGNITGRIDWLEKQVAVLKGGRRATVDRGITASVPAPVEGQMMIEGTDLYYYAEGAWHKVSGASRFTYLFGWPTDPVTTDAFADATCANFALPSDLAGLGIVGVEAFLAVPSNSGQVELDIHRFWPDLAGAGASIFVTNLTIDQDEYNSLDAAVPPVISSPTFDAGDYIVIQRVDPGTDALGLGVHFWFGEV